MDLGPVASYRGLGRAWPTSWLSEPSCQRVAQSGVSAVPYPGDVAIGSDQYGSGGGDVAQDWKLPIIGICGIDHLNPIGPGRDVEANGLSEVEEHRPGIVQQGEDPKRAVGGNQVEIGHAPPEQRVALTEIVLNV